MRVVQAEGDESSYPSRGKVGGKEVGVLLEGGDGRPSGESRVPRGVEGLHVE